MRSRGEKLETVSLGGDKRAGTLWETGEMTSRTPGNTRCIRRVGV